MEDGQVVEDRDTRLPLLLSSVSRISQWSDIDELVDPVRHRGKRRIRGRIQNIKEYSTYLALLSYNIVGLMMDSLKQKW